MRLNTLYRSEHTRTGRPGIVRLVLFCLVAAILVRLFLFRSYRVEGDAMLPAYPHGSRVLVSRFIFGIRIPFFNGLAIPSFVSPGSGDVVFCLDPSGRGYSGFADFLEAASFSLLEPAAGREVLLRRVIAVPGSLVRLDADGLVHLDGKPLARDKGRPVVLHTLRPDPDTVVRVLEDGRGTTAWTTAPGRERIAEGQYPARTKHVLFREGERDILQLDVPAGRSSGLARPFPRPEKGPGGYAAFAKLFIQRGLLDDAGLETPLELVRFGDAPFQPRQDAIVVAWNESGEIRYAAPGEAELRPLVVRENGELWLKIPGDRYFVLADNRDLSRDSREWGLVRHADILGTPFWAWSKP